MLFGRLVRKFLPEMPFYAVAETKAKGAAIFTQWNDCKNYTAGRQVKFKKFEMIDEAHDFIKGIQPKYTVRLGKNEYRWETKVLNHF